MRPYGEQPRGGKTHDADRCDVCAASRGQTGAARMRQRRRARRTEAQDIEQQLPAPEPAEQMDCDAAEGRDGYGGALDSMYAQLRAEEGAES